MNININIPLKLFERIIVAVERLADDFHDLHRYELDSVRQEVPDYVPKVYYQNDAELAREELREQLAQAARDEVGG